MWVFHACENPDGPSALSLFMLRIFADHHHNALASDDLALIAYFLNGWLNLHYNTIPFLLSPPGNAALGQVVNRNLNRYLITGQNPNIVHS